MNLPSKAFAEAAAVHIQRLENSKVILPALGVLGTVLLILAAMGAA